MIKKGYCWYCSKSLTKPNTYTIQSMYKTEYSKYGVMHSECHYRAEISGYFETEYYKAFKVITE